MLPDVCGIAYVGGGAGLAFSTTNDGCWNGYTHAHEIGHNQGCWHNIEESPDAGWRNGWRRCDLGTPGFKTILSYGCPNNMRTNEAAIFATPSRVLSNGIALGHASRGHCARAIAESAAAIANYRKAPTTDNSNAISITASPGLCVDAPTFNNGQQVYLHPCHGGNNQRLERQADGSLRFAGTNKCLDVNGQATSDGTKVQVWDCNRGPAQIWSRDENGALRPQCAPSSCLDVPRQNFAQGTLMHIWSCNASPAQQMNAPFVPVVPSNSISAGNLCVDAPNWNNGARAYLFPCHGGNNQRFELRTDGSLRWPGTNKCLDVNGGTSADGTAVQVWDCNGSPAQRWARDSNNALRTPTGRCLDVPGSRFEQGAQMQIWGCNGSPAQRFRADFVPRTLRARSTTGGRNSTELPLLTREEAAAQASTRTDATSPVFVSADASAADPDAASSAAAATATAAAADSSPKVPPGIDAVAFTAEEAAAAAAAPSSPPTP
ncbi:ricin B lectin domain-containing protein [Scenedesmus sp. NREL 46B-D3]|nr:ricin B lectin domain-containing protein [Scenedesmus sp. NREL 46B-D3]